MRLFAFLFVCSALLTGCGGGGSDSGGGGSTPPPPTQVTNNIVAIWTFVYPNQCVETYEFDASGNFEINSANSFIAGSYQFDSTVSAGSRHPLTLTVEQQNLENDCENSFEDVVGGVLEVYASFSGNSMQWFENETGGTALIAMQRAARLSVSNVPSSVTIGSELSFNVQKDSDSAFPITLLYGPAGTAISEDGDVTWTASLPMISETNTVSFAFTSNDVVDPISVDVDVSFNDFTPPTIRKGIDIAYYPGGIQIGDFDSNGESEIVVLDQFGALSFIQATGSEYESTFTYPYSLNSTGNATRLSVYDTNGDGNEEVYVLGKKAVYYIGDVNKPPQIVYSSSTAMVNFLVRNIDSDAAPELIVLFEERSSESNLVVLDDDFTTELLGTTITVDDRIEFDVANVDSDSALELVISSGQVIDLDSGDIQWNNGQGFGRVLTTGDVNNDGIDEIIAALNWTSLIVWNADAQSQIATIENDDNCSVVAADIDADGADEIILGDCQWGNITAYDITGDTYSQAWALPLIGHGSESLAVGDTNGNGQLELVWGTGGSTTGEDQVVVAALSPVPEVVWFNENPAQLDSFYPVGWANISPTEEAAIYVIPETDSGYDGQRYALMTSEGDVTISEEISTNWSREYKGIIGDSNGDGYDELFLLGADLYDPRVDVINLDSGISQWQIGGDSFDSDFSAIHVADINNDGNDDLLLADEEILTIYDISNDTVIDTWSTGARIYNVTTVKDSDDNNVIIVGSWNGLVALNINSSNSLTMRASNSAARACSYMLEAATEDAFLCGTQDYSEGGVTTYSLNLSEMAYVPINREFTGMVNVPNSNNVLIAEIPELDYFSANETLLTEIDTTTGGVVWQSAALSGRGVINSLKLGNPNGNSSVLMGTGSGMVLTH
ncbi:hypothetical protein N9V74_02635 [Alteromonas sp.]|nr:hypothetical protein [Alteromonas sp.]